MLPLPCHDTHQTWLFLGQQVAVALIIEFELSHSTARIACRLIKLDRKVEKAAEHLKLTIHRSKSPRPLVLSRSLEPFMFELLDQKRRDLAQHLALEVLLQDFS